MTNLDDYFRAYHNAARRWADSLTPSADLIVAIQKDPELQDRFTYAARDVLAFEARNLRRKAARQLPRI